MIINFSNLGGGGGGGYTLPTATSQTLGGVKIGSGITVTGDGTISVTGGSGEAAFMISLSALSDFSQDDLDAMQDMVDYIANYDDDEVPAARICCGDYYYILSRVQRDSENHLYWCIFSNAEALFYDEQLKTLGACGIESFWLNASDVSESYAVYIEQDKCLTESSTDEWLDNYKSRGIFEGYSEDGYPYRVFKANMEVVSGDGSDAPEQMDLNTAYTLTIKGVPDFTEYDGDDYETIMTINDVGTIVMNFDGELYLFNENEYPDGVILESNESYTGDNSNATLEIGDMVRAQSSLLIEMTVSGDSSDLQTDAEPVDYFFDGEVYGVWFEYLPTMEDIPSGSSSASDYLPLITVLPVNPEDGAVYNYKGTLIKYVNGAGNWGYWYGKDFVTYNYSALDDVKASVFFYYAVIPESMDGQLLCGLQRISTVYDYLFFNLANGTLDAYSNSAKTGSTIYQVQKNGAEVYAGNSNSRFYVSWKDNVIQFRRDNTYCGISASTMNDGSINTAHYELVNRPDKPNYPAISGITPAQNCFAKFDSNGMVLPGYPISVTRFYINTSGSTSSKSVTYPQLAGNSSFTGRIWAPENSGETGTLCVSQGANSAPVFKTVAQALGVNFWTGTQDEYDDLSTYSPTTLYIIIPDA